MKKELTNDEKIKTLERIIKAVFGSPDKATIEYRSRCDDCYEVIVECDVDDAVKLLTALSLADIDYWFYTGERKLSLKDAKLWKKLYEGYTEIILMLEPQLWKETEKLKEEIKVLKMGGKSDDEKKTPLEALKEANIRNKIKKKKDNGLVG